MACRGASCGVVRWLQADAEAKLDMGGELDLNGEIALQDKANLLSKRMVQDALMDEALTQQVGATRAPLWQLTLMRYNLAPLRSETNSSPHSATHRGSSAAMHTAQSIRLSWP